MQQKGKVFFSSFAVSFRLRSWLKMRLIAISMVSWSGILVKRLVTSFPLFPFPFPLTKFDKGNRDVILDWKLYDKAIQRSISGTAKFEKLDEDPTLKLEALLQRFLRKL